MTFRTVKMPGPPRIERIIAVPAGAVPIDTTLAPGRPLLDALAGLLPSHAAESACLTLTGGGFFPFAYVIPALSPDATHAAFYSETFRPPGLSRLDTAAVTLGFRDGQPFFHCHARWTEPDGRPGCGHVLPDDTMIAEPIHARGAGIIGARFEVTPDPETGFSLFMPRPTGTRPPSSAAKAIALRLAPNQDLITALERVGAEAGFTQAVLHGGVASINGARFLDAPPIEGFATELLVVHSTVHCAGGGPATEIDIAIVDFHGTIGAGRLTAGDNPVLMTFEGLLEAI